MKKRPKRFMHIKRWHPNGLVTLHGNGNGIGTKWEVQYAVEMFTLVEDRDGDQDLLFPIVPVRFPTLAPVPF